tara:strand:- start:235 stop:516 length:282 start_codon:yes stop_codon:yes gene_type:complete
MTLTTAETIRLVTFIRRAHDAGALDNVVATGFDYLGYTANLEGKDRCYAEVELHFEDADGREVSSGVLLNGGAGVTRNQALETLYALAGSLAA